MARGVFAARAAVTLAVACMLVVLRVAMWREYEPFRGPWVILVAVLLVATLVAFFLTWRWLGPQQPKATNVLAALLLFAAGNFTIVFDSDRWTVAGVALVALGVFAMTWPYIKPGAQRALISHPH